MWWKKKKSVSGNTINPTTQVLKLTKEVNLPYLEKFSGQILNPENIEIKEFEPITTYKVSILHKYGNFTRETSIHRDLTEEQANKLYDYYLKTNGQNRYGTIIKEDELKNDF